MNKSTLLGTITAYLLVASLSVNAESFSIPFGSSYPERGSTDGLAVNPINENVIITSTSPRENIVPGGPVLPPGGADNLWAFSSSGDLLGSNRTTFDLGDYGWLGPATMGNEGRLFIIAVTKSGSDYPHFVTTNVIGVNQDGYTINPAFSLDQYITTEQVHVGMYVDITYNSIANLLVVSVWDAATQEYVLREFTTDGTLLHTFNVNANLAGESLTFDAVTGNYFSLRLDKRYPLLDEFTRNPQGEYQLLNTYDLASTGRQRGPMDISRSTGLVYVTNGYDVRVFDKSVLPLVQTRIPNDVVISDVKRVTAIEGCGKSKETGYTGTGYLGRNRIKFDPLGTFTLYEWLGSSETTYSGKYEWVNEGETLSLSLDKRSRTRLWKHIKRSGSSLCRADVKLKKRKIKKFIVKYDTLADDPKAVKLIAKFKLRNSTGARKGKYEVVVTEAFDY
jgi:hypothetical protein